jgi:hypothetical protein
MWRSWTTFEEYSASVILMTKLKLFFIHMKEFLFLISQSSPSYIWQKEILIIIIKDRTNLSRFMCVAHMFFRRKTSSAAMLYDYFFFLFIKMTNSEILGRTFYILLVFLFLTVSLWWPWTCFLLNFLKRIFFELIYNV